MAGLTEAFKEAEALSEARRRAEDIAADLGMPQSCQPLPGESSSLYRARMAQRLSEYSHSYRGKTVVNIRDKALLEAVEKQVYQEARQHAESRVIQPGKLFMTEKRDEAGRSIRAPSNDSDPRAWMDGFSNGALYVGKIRDPQTIK